MSSKFLSVLQIAQGGKDILDSSKTNDAGNIVAAVAQMAAGITSIIKADPALIALTNLQAAVASATKITRDYSDPTKSVDPADFVAIAANLTVVVISVGSTHPATRFLSLWIGILEVVLGDIFIRNAEAAELNSRFQNAKSWRWIGDPIVIDLGGDGLNTVGLESNIYFDHDGDGVKTNTGWVGTNDALLVWDRNANGNIDSGAELFGDFTPLPNGALAPNGFSALAALDSNGDGVLDASDPGFASLRLWRDSSQDGLSGSSELLTLTEVGITSLQLTNTLKNQGLSNGNTLSREGSFTKADGSTGAMGEFKFVVDAFDTQFTDTIEVPLQLQGLPNVAGSGKVRELQQAATQSAVLADLVTQFQSAGTRAEQRALIEDLLTAWAGTSGMAANMKTRAGSAFRVQYESINNVRRSTNVLTGASAQEMTLGAMVQDVDAPFLTESYRNLISEWSNKLHVLEAFNGQYFFNVPGQNSQTPDANWGLWVRPGYSDGTTTVLPVLNVNLSFTQAELLQKAYDSLVESVYAGLVMQTRLKPYLDQVQLVMDEAAVRLDMSIVNQMLSDKLVTDPLNGLADMLDLDRYAGSMFASSNWMGLTQLDKLLDVTPRTPALEALLSEFNLVEDAGSDSARQFVNEADLLLGNSTSNDHIYGFGGNDRIYGQGGDDVIYASDGDDLLSGGAGNDVLYGGWGADTYVKRPGFQGGWLA